MKSWEICSGEFGTVYGQIQMQKPFVCGRNLDAELAEHVFGEMDVHRFGTSNPKWAPKGMNPKVDNPKQMWKVNVLAS